MRGTAIGCRTLAVCFRAGPVKRHAALLRLLHRLRPQERNVAASGMKNSEVEWEPFSVSLSRLTLAGAPARSIVLLQALIEAKPYCLISNTVRLSPDVVSPAQRKHRVPMSELGQNAKNSQ